MAFGSHWSNRKRLLIGVLVLLLVDIIFVASSEVSKILFTTAAFDKPFFSTYFKTSMFTILLLGFVSKSWRKLACPVESTNVNDSIFSEDESINPTGVLSSPVFVPVRRAEDTESENYDDNAPKAEEKIRLRLVNEDISTMTNGKSVHFNSISEVRHLADSQAEDAVLSRLSYQAYIEAQEAINGHLTPFTMRQVVHLALMFCVLWFIGNLSYQVAVLDTDPGIVNALSSSSSLFTLVLSGVFPGSPADAFNVSKLLAVAISLTGVIMVTLADARIEMHDLAQKFPYGAVWALCGALAYSLYLVLMRRKVDREERMSLPMFFGFVGLLNTILLWPGFILGEYSGLERFQMPNATQWILLTANGAVGTVAVELLWLWGCFLTSSLMATLGLSLTMPLTIMADYVIRGTRYNWVFYLGTFPLFVGFLIVALLTHHENADPVGRCFRYTFSCCFKTPSLENSRSRKPSSARIRPIRGELCEKYGEQSDQTESLLAGDDEVS